MLQISQEMFEAFSEDALVVLARRIDAWLPEVAPAWAAIAPEQRRIELDAMVSRAIDSGMETERDVSVFAWICTALGADWRARLAEQDTASMLASPEWDCEAKLLRLDETFRLSEAAQRQAGSTMPHGGGE